MMINVAKELAVQSFCYRGFKSNEELIAKIKETGLAKVELCGVHVDFADEAGCDEVISLYRGEGVEIVSIGVNGLSGDETKERKFFEFVRKCGAEFMSIDLNVGAFHPAVSVAQKLADEYGIRLGIHNHGGRHWLGSAQMLEQVFQSTSDRIGLCLDTAWAMHSHEDPIAMVERFADRLYAVHLKDFAFDRAGQHEDVVVGTGNLDLDRLNEALRSADFNGCAVLEYEGDVANPVPALTRCVESIRAKMAG